MAQNRLLFILNKYENLLLWTKKRNTIQKSIWGNFYTFGQQCVTPRSKYFPTREVFKLIPILSNI